MKKTLAILIALVLSMVFLASCSGGANYDSVANMAPGSGGSSESAASAYPSSDGGMASGGNTSSGSGLVPVAETAVDEHLAEKIIYTVYADIEALDFDESIENVYRLLTAHGAFIESSYVGGVNYSARYHGWQTYRSANFVLRVPKNQLNAVTASLGSLGNVTSLRSDAENITARFTDMESRLSSLWIQEERLLDMLRRAEDVPDMIAIEERLSDVRYQIESITATLRNWQNQVDYSTLHLYIQEVETYTEITQVQQRTYWQQVSEGFVSNMRGVGRFFANFFKWLVINLPVLVVLAVVAIVVIIIVRKQIKRSAKRRAEQAKNTPHTQGNPYMQSYQYSPYGQQMPVNAQNPQPVPYMQNVPAPQSAQEPVKAPEPVIPTEPESAQEQGGAQDS